MVITKIFSIACGAVALFVSCCKQETGDALLDYYENAPSSIMSLVDTLDLEQFGILVPTKIIIYKDSFIVQKGLSENHIDILTPERKIISCVRRGRGPGELTDIGSLQVQGDMLFVFGPSQKKLIVLDIPGTIAAQEQLILEENQLGSLDHKASDLMALPVRISYFKDHYYAVGLFGNGSLYAELSREGVFISGIPGPELGDNRLSPLDRWSLNMDALMSLSPDGTKIAVAYVQIAAISFAHTQPLLTEQWSKVFFPPRLWLPDQPELMVSYEKENVVTFRGLQATDSTVYALYSGRNRIGDEENKADHCVHLFAFDWNGAPLMHYELEVPVAGFWMDDDTLYGVSFYPCAKVYQFRPTQPVVRRS